MMDKFIWTDRDLVFDEPVIARALYDPTQPRVPAGQGDASGQWVSYHGTTLGAVEDILRSGLQASRAGTTFSISHKGTTYVTTDLFAAINWAQEAVRARRAPGADKRDTVAVVLTVHVPPGHEREFRKDPNVRTPGVDQGPLEHVGDIPAAWIEPVVEFYRPSDHPQKLTATLEDGKLVLRDKATGQIATLAQGLTLYVIVTFEQDEPTAAAYNPDQPRVPAGNPGTGGRWTDSGPTSQRFPNVDAVPSSNMRAEIASDLVKKVADQMGFPADHITVIDRPPTSFTVGEAVFSEGGHYSVANGGEIEVNAHNWRLGASSIDEIGFQSLVAHEITHHVYRKVSELRDAEHKIIHDQIIGDDTQYLRYFRANGYPRPEMLPELQARFPASAAWAATWGDSYLSPQRTDSTAQGYAREMTNANGFTAYSKAYWADYRSPTPRFNAQERAINETLAEVARVRHGGIIAGLSPVHQKWQEMYDRFWTVYNDRIKPVEPS